MKYLIYEVGKSPQRDNPPFDEIDMSTLSLLIDDGVYRFYNPSAFNQPIVAYPINQFWILRSDA